MLRIAVLAFLLALSSPVLAETMSAADLTDEAKRLDQRSLTGYDSALQHRDMFATLHDSVWHPAYKEAKAARAAYDRVRADLTKAIAANDTRTGARLLGELETAAETLSSKLERYVQSSSGAMEKILLVLGVGAFAIGGLVYWLLRMLRKKPKARA